MDSKYIYNIYPLVTESIQSILYYFILIHYPYTFIDLSIGVFVGGLHFNFYQ